MTIDKITVSSRMHSGANPGGRVGRTQPALRLFDNAGYLVHQPNTFEFWPAGYVLGDSSKENFMMTAVFKGGPTAQQLVRTDYESVPNDRWVYASTTYDGTTGLDFGTKKKQ